EFGDPPLVVSLATSAVVTGPVTICVDFAFSAFVDPSRVHLLQIQGSGWVDVTSSVDEAGETICGNVSSLATVVVAEFVGIPQTTPTITWPLPLGIVYGTLLGPAQLNATS